MQSNLLDNVRQSCCRVVEHASFVKIDASRLREYARSLPVEKVKAPELDGERHYLGNGEDTAAFLITLDAINFGSGYFPHLKKRVGMSGYFTVASSLTDYYRKKGPLLPYSLSKLTPEECAVIFGQDINNEPVIELMGLFSKALNDLGNFILERYNGSFASMVEDAGSSSKRLVEILVRMPFFNDRVQYKGFDVHFYKRAQITPADLAIAFEGKGLGKFDDLSELTIFADNLVPHVLRIDRVLVYDESLASRIDSGELIVSGSQEEIEMRASAVHTGELLVKEFREMGHEVRAMDIDYLLWNRGQEPYYKQIKPRHRARSIFY